MTAVNIVFLSNTTSLQRGVRHKTGFKLLMHHIKNTVIY